jgi:hypothetical protein
MSKLGYDGNLSINYLDQNNTNAAVVAQVAYFIVKENKKAAFVAELAASTDTNVSSFMSNHLTNLGLSLAAQNALQALADGNFTSADQVETAVMIFKGLEESNTTSAQISFVDNVVVVSNFSTSEIVDLTKISGLKSITSKFTNINYSRVIMWDYKVNGDDTWYVGGNSGVETTDSNFSYNVTLTNQGYVKKLRVKLYDNDNNSSTGLDYPNWYIINVDANLSGVALNEDINGLVTVYNFEKNSTVNISSKIDGNETIKIVFKNPEGLTLTPEINYSVDGNVTWVNGYSGTDVNNSNVYIQTGFSSLYNTNNDLSLMYYLKTANNAVYEWFTMIVK